MKNGSRERGVGGAGAEDFDEVIGMACASGGDYGNVHGTGDRLREITIETGGGAVAIH